MIIRTIGVFLACIILITSTAILQATAQDSAELLAVMEDLNAAFNAHDIDQWVSYCTDDIIHDYVPFPPLMNGKGEMRVFMDNLFHAFPDIQTSQQLVLTAGNILVEENIYSATFLGEWAGIQPTGNGGPVMELDIYEFEGDKVKRSTRYLDYVTFMVVVGLMPAPEPFELAPSFTLPDPEPIGLSSLEAAAELDARFNAHDLESYAKLIHPDAEVLFAPLGVPMDRDAFIAALELYLLAFSDLQQEIVRMDDMGDGWVLEQVLFKGTNDGPYFGVPATGNSYENRGAALVRFDTDGLLTNVNLYWDELAVLTQLGLVPPPTAVSPARKLETTWGKIKAK